MTLTGMNQERHKIIMAADREGFYKPPGTPTSEQVSQSLFGKNKFVTVYDFHLKKFVKCDNVDKVLGYPCRKFTIEALNNSPYSHLKLTHVHDIEHKNRYDTIAYMVMVNAHKVLARKNYQLGTITDYYQISFRLLHADGHFVKVRRSCYLGELTDEGIPKNHFDVWEVIKPGFDSVVEPLFVTEHYNEIFYLFYELNCKTLGIRFSKRQCQVLEGKVKGYSNKETGEKLYISSHAVKRHIDDMKVKADDFFAKRESEEKVRGADGLIAFARTYGLYPMPVQYLLDDSGKVII